MSGKGAKGKTTAAKKGGKPAPASANKDWKSKHEHLFSANKRTFRVGRDNRPRGIDLSRYVKWPLYVRLQRQRAILKQRLKVPPALNQFTRTLEKNPATTLFQLMARYRPESKEQKKERRLKAAGDEVKNQDRDPKNKPRVLKFGINHITSLVESKKAKLVVIAHDVDPIELVVWLPALCRKMEVPYVIVKGKARLGRLVYKKTCTAIAVTDVNKEDQASFGNIVNNARVTYNDDLSGARRKWGGGIKGIKAQHVVARREKAIQRELAAKLK
jgi:large subunit ribosomal protein L7Ae